MTGATIDFPVADDRRFFRNLITAMAVILVMGFVVQLAAGRSSFNSPLIIHLHAFAFMAWTGITLTQTWLAASGNLALHRKLGLLSVGWVILLLILGPLVTISTVQTARTPFFFQPQHFLVANPMTLLGFAGLFGAALALRRQTDWHTRLQVGAFTMLMGPSFGRILPMPFLPPYAFETAGLVALIFPIIGMLRDWRVHGRPHAAWLWSIAVLLAVTLLPV
ncbi:MAG: hypothetical protein KBF30_03890 [Hyphomonadaceae bacterium]|nr:hypothetical protein [Hyphomonadaceae bacterium]